MIPTHTGLFILEAYAWFVYKQSILYVMHTYIEKN